MGARRFRIEFKEFLKEILQLFEIFIKFLLCSAREWHPQR